MKNGLYEKVLDLKSKQDLSNKAHKKIRAIDNSEVSKALSITYQKAIRESLSQLPNDLERAQFIADLNKTIGMEDFIYEDKKFKELLAIHDEQQEFDVLNQFRPKTSISSSTLFTGNSGPTLESELRREIRTADEIDFLISFIKFSGLRLIYDDLVEFTKTKKLRVITTSYMGASDYKAILDLAKLPNTEVKISFDTKRTRLHAKAYHFKRETGFSTAYIGSSNLSNPALSNGLEWNLKVSEYTSKDVVDSFNKTFETYWNDEEFRIFSPEDEENRRELKESLSIKGQDQQAYTFFNLKPYSHQKEILEDLKLEREEYGSYKNLVVAATGSGKTYAMLFLSRMLATHYRDVFDAPTIIVIVDRDDLNKQTSKLFEDSKQFLKDKKVMSIPDRQALNDELANNQSGGIYITTIQKFCETTGLLSERNNIICISDEAHRSQTNIGSKLKYTEKGVETTYGFAKYLRDSFPNATYVGFTGTPIDETIHVFGEIVDSYTMKESSDDGITVRIQYEPRLARVIVSEEQVREIDKYYEEVIKEGSNPEQVETSKRAMSKLSKILGHPDRISKLAYDIVEHYTRLCSEKPNIVQKAMIVCANRTLAFLVYKKLEDIKPEWFDAKKTEREDLDDTQLEKLKELSKVNLVATQGNNDPQELFDLCGNKSHRQMLDEQFKNNDSNFKIAIVVDMWITGFDVASLAVMYIDKPLQKHTLIQTISRVNRVFEGKETGLVVDYIGIKEEMLKAAKQYGSPQESPIDELSISLSIFRNHLSLIEDMFIQFDSSKFFNGNPTERLLCLNLGSEFIQTSKETEMKFMDLSRKMKAAYEISYPSGQLTDKETNQAQFYLAIRSIIYKQTKGNAPDAEVMNRVVEKMVYDAITSTGVEDIVNKGTDELFGEEFQKQVDEIDMPISKFNALLKLLRRAISKYGENNKVKAIEFSERLKRVVESYNNRDSQVFVSEVVYDFINSLSDELLEILKALQEDKISFEKMGISYEEKAFYDILIKVRDDNDFVYEDSKCLILAKAIKELVDDKSQYADWASRDDIKNQLNMDLTVLLYKHGYPPEWDEEIFEKVMEQAENFKKNVIDDSNILSLDKESKLNKLIKYPTKDNIQSINLRVAETNINAREDE